MKLTVTNGVVTVSSETKGEALELFTYAMDIKKEPKEVVKNKKHNHKKVCDLCGKECKGLIGLNSHRSTVHKLRAPLYEHHKALYEARKARKALSELAYGIN